MATAGAQGYSRATGLHNRLLYVQSPLGLDPWKMKGQSPSGSLSVMLPFDLFPCKAGRVLACLCSALGP